LYIQLIKGFSDRRIEAHKIVYGFGRLQSVYSYVWRFQDASDIKSAYRVSFEAGGVFHEAGREYDEISCDSVLREEYDDITDVSVESPWCSK
jgi:hypothetical protein